MAVSATLTCGCRTRAQPHRRRTSPWAPRCGASTGVSGGTAWRMSTEAITVSVSVTARWGHRISRKRSGSRCWCRLQCGGCYRLIRPAGPVPWVLGAVSGNGLGIPLRARASTFRARSEGTGVPWGLPGNGGISVELGVCRVTGGSRVIGRGVSGCLGVSVSPPIVTGRIAQRNPHRKKVPRSPRRPPGASGGRDPYEDRAQSQRPSYPLPGARKYRASPHGPRCGRRRGHTHTHGTRDDPLVVLGMVGRASPQPPAAPL